MISAIFCKIDKGECVKNELCNDKIYAGLGLLL